MYPHRLKILDTSTQRNRLVKSPFLAGRLVYNEEINTGLTHSYVPIA